MASIREQIISALFSVIETALPDVALMRSPVDPLSRNLPLAIVLDWVGEEFTPLTFGHHDVDLSVRISVFSRADGVEQSVDAHMVTVHSALMLDRSLGGLCSDIGITSSSKSRNDLDDHIVSVAHEYNVKYRIISNNITAH